MKTMIHDSPRHAVWAGWAYRPVLGAGAVLYSAGMLAEAVLGWPLDPRTALLSELAARDRAHRRIFQSGDLLAGGLFTVAGLARARRARAAGVSRRAPGRRLAPYLLLFGLSTIADALSPLDHPISQPLGASGRPPADSSRPGRRRLPSLSHTTHYLTTSVAGMAAAGICLEHHRLQPDPAHPLGGTPRRVLARAAGPLVIVLLAGGVLSLLSPRMLPGLVQRTQTLAFSAVCLDLAGEDRLSPGRGW